MTHVQTPPPTDPSEFFEIRLGLSDALPNKWYTTVTVDENGDIWAKPFWWDGERSYEWDEAHELGLVTDE